MSENINALFPREYLDQLLAHARTFDKDDRTYRSDAFDELLTVFPTGGEFRRDSVEAYYFARQLEYIKAGVMATQFPSLKGRLLVPFDTTPDDGAEQYTLRYSTQVGRARVSKDMRGIIPDVDVSVSEQTFPILSILLQYGYTLQEVRAAIRERKSLPTDRAMRCREQMEREVDAIALIGHTDAGLKGLFNMTTGATAVDTYTIPAGSGGSKSWLLKNSEEVLTDWNKSVSQVVTNSKEVEAPNTSVLPTSRFEHVTTKRVGDGTSDTIATYFKRNNPHIKSVESSPYLEANEAAANTRMVNYEKSPLKVSLILPVPLESLSPDVSSTETKVKMHSRTAGVMAHRPRSIIYSDEI